MIITQRIEQAGITLELSACISAEAVGLAVVDPQVASELSHISIGSSTADQLAVLAPMQQMLVQAHEALRKSLVQLALAHLERQVTEAIEEVGRLREQG